MLTGKFVSLGCLAFLSELGTRTRLLSCLAGATLLSTAAHAQVPSSVIPSQPCNIPAAKVQPVQSQLAKVVNLSDGKWRHFQAEPHVVGRCGP